jgi:hypothetical protein
MKNENFSGLCYGWTGSIHQWLLHLKGENYRLKCGLIKLNSQTYSEMYTSKHKGEKLKNEIWGYWERTGWDKQGSIRKLQQEKKKWA